LEKIGQLRYILKSIVLGGVLYSMLGALSAHSQPNIPTIKSGTVHAASYFHTPAGCEGDTHPVVIQLEPNPSPRIQVGFFESSAGAIGPQWRAAGWMAALVATTLLEENLHAYRISYTLEGLIDGPSAGALTTCGLMAVMRGDRIPDNVSMTGTVNPDGTIGPVGGIPHKILGAAQAGTKRFAIPLGQRRDTNLCTGNEEDVIALGRSLGIEVAEVGDVREAYAFLTGSALPQPPAAPLSSEIPDAVRMVFRQFYMSWKARYDVAKKTVTSAQPAELTPELRSLWEGDERLAKAAQEELRTGHEAAAFNRIWMAVLNGEFVAKGVLSMRALHTRGFPGLHGSCRQKSIG
jgi:uncharacterized protein